MTTPEQMPETIWIDNITNDSTTQYTRHDKYEALKQSYDRLCHLLENYTFLDEGMDAGTRAEIYAESKQALAESEKVSAE